MRWTKDSFSVGARVEVRYDHSDFKENGTVVKGSDVDSDLWILIDDTNAAREHFYTFSEPFALCGWSEYSISLLTSSTQDEETYYVRTGDNTPFESTDKSEAIGYAKALKAMGIIVRVETEETIQKVVWS